MSDATPKLEIRAPHLRPRRGLAPGVDPRLAEAANPRPSEPTAAAEELRQAAQQALPPPEHASLVTKASRLRVELRGWAQRGARLADKPTRAARAAACNACEYFNASGNLGLGECLAPGCGCTKLKRWLATARCPHPAGSRWPA